MNIQTVDAFKGEKTFIDRTLQKNNDKPVHKEVDLSCCRVYVTPDDQREFVNRYLTKEQTKNLLKRHIYRGYEDGRCPNHGSTVVNISASVEIT